MLPLPMNLFAMRGLNGIPVRPVGPSFPQNPGMEMWGGQPPMWGGQGFGGFGGRPPLPGMPPVSGGPAMSVNGMPRQMQQPQPQMQPFNQNLMAMRQMYGY